MADIRSRALDRARADVYLCMDPDSPDSVAARERAWDILLYVSRKTISEIRRTKTMTEGEP